MLCQLPEKADNLSKEEERGLHFGYGSRLRENGESDKITPRIVAGDEGEAVY